MIRAYYMGDTLCIGGHISEEWATVAFIQVDQWDSGEYCGMLFIDGVYVTEFYGDTGMSAALKCHRRACQLGHFDSFHVDRVDLIEGYYREMERKRPQEAA